MPAALLLLASLLFGFAERADNKAPREASSYSGTSIVNAADNQPGWLAPNTIGTLYGSELAYTTRALTSDDISGGILPTVLPGTGVRILVGNIPAVIYFVSPGQINFLVPSLLLPVESHLQLVIDGRAGPDIKIQLAPAAPAFFQLDPQTVIATHADGSVITTAAAAKPGEYVVLYATGLGETNPPSIYRQVPVSAATLKQISDLKILLDGVAIDSIRIKYAGVAPGFAGLYQINVQLPDSVGSNPEIRVGLGAQLSRTGVKLPVQP
jgi:uncharacterized protein (TIGR03437 family)